jgi:glycosyltransferase involved in cell wall biosynthesis
LRILHVVPTYLPATRYGGPIFAVHGLCKALAARGHEVSVFTTNVDGDGTSDVQLNEPVLMDGVRVHYFAQSLRRLYFSLPMRTMLHRHVADFDVVHAHSVFLWPTAAAARTARSKGVPYIISPRGMLVPELVRKKSRLVKTAWIALVERQNIAHACAVHFTSTREREDAAALGIAAPRAAVIPNGVALPLARTDAREPATILFLGRVNWKKGLDRLLAAMALIDPRLDARLIVAGRDDEGYAATLPRSDRVTFIGEVGGAEKERLLATATMLVLPSLSENFGNVVLEALAHETPVIVTPGVGLADDVAGSGTGIVSDGAPEALAAAMQRLLSNRDEAAEMGRRGRVLVESRFTWERVAEEMEALYRSCSTTSRR